VRIILHNELYHGVLVDGKSANVDKDGEAGVKVRRPKSDGRAWMFPNASSVYDAEVGTSTRVTPT